MTSQDVYDLVFQTGVSSLKLDEIISKDSAYSYYYARDILKGRFELGEKAISKIVYYSYYYAIEILKWRFELGEEAMSKDWFYSCDYAINVLKGRFKLGEELMTNHSDLVYYFIEVMRYNHD